MPGSVSKPVHLTRWTLSLLAVTLACVWFVSIYTVRTMRADMVRTLGEQQFSTASMIAAQVNDQLQHRLDQLTHMAASMTPSSVATPQAATAVLMENRGLAQEFNGGIFITGADGTAIADFPVVAGRVGTNYMDRESVSVPLKEGKPVIGRPNMGKTLKAPIFSIVVPVRAKGGAVVGVIVGTVNLGLPNFLDKLTTNRYGKSGGYLLIAPQYRLIITASDKRRVMETLPPRGAIPTMDRMLDGYEGTDIFVNAKGVEVLNSGAIVAASGWRVVVTVPTADAFAAIGDLQQRVLMAATLASMLACALTWWLFNSQRSAALAFYDPLTQLANRRLMQDRLAQTAAASRRSGNAYAVMVLDLDNFKPLNDRHGHMVGDLLLSEVANRLRRTVRDVDTVARFGGDEFVVILGGLDNDRTLAVAQVMAIGEKIRQQLGQPYSLKVAQRNGNEGTVEHRCTVSVGIVVAQDLQCNPDEILKQADRAMYQAKEAGRNTIRMLEPAEATGTASA